MGAMTGRQRVMAALSHEEPDRVPIDFGGVASGIASRSYARLAEHLGMDDELKRPDLRDPSNTVVAGAEVLERFGVDVRPLKADSPQNIHEQLDEKTYRDGWGAIWVRPEEDSYINKGGPFQGRKLSVADLDRHPWPDPQDPDLMKGLGERARELYEGTDCAVVMPVGNAAVALAQRLRGFSEWMEDLLLDPAVAEGLMEHATDVVARFVRAALHEVGPYVDIVYFADDLGFQDRPYMNPDLYRRMVKPHHRRVVEAIKGAADVKVVMHSDGSIYDLIPDLIDVGVDAINPVQVSAKNMGSKRLKAEFGDHIAFWGGIDTQHVLPFGGPDDVEAEVRTRIGHLAPGGGYVLASVHTMRPEVPPENIVAMFESALRYGRYEEMAAV